MREPVCLDSRLRMPFKLVMPPTQKVCIKRDPKPRVLEIATQVSFKGTDGRFGLRLGNWNVEERVVGGVEPYPCISVEHPMTPALGITELRR
jgi:hypothetical protein